MLINCPKNKKIKKYIFTLILDLVIVSQNILLEATK